MWRNNRMESCWAYRGSLGDMVSVCITFTNHSKLPSINWIMVTPTMRREHAAYQQWRHRCVPTVRPVCLLFQTRYPTSHKPTNRPERRTVAKLESTSLNPFSNFFMRMCCWLKHAHLASKYYILYVNRWLCQLVSFFGGNPDLVMLVTFATSGTLSPLEENDFDCRIVSDLTPRRLGHVMWRLHGPGVNHFDLRPNDLEGGGDAGSCPYF